MNEIEVPLKITGVGAIKKELRDLKSAIDSATDSEQIAKLSQRAGELKDRLADANEQVSIFASGSKFEQVSNGLGSIKDSIMSLDFQEAGEKAKLLTTALKGINPAEFAAQFKGFGQVILSLGSAVGVAMKQFIAFGASLLVNPIFLLVAVITAIVAAILIFLNKMGILKKVIDTLMKPINDLIAGFKAMTDWLGLTSYAAEENAERIVKANEKAVASSQKRKQAIVGNYDFEIKKAEINGKDTTDLELSKSKTIGYLAQKDIDRAKKDIQELSMINASANKEKITKLREQVTENTNILKAERVNRKIIALQAAADRQKEAADEHKKAVEQAKKFAQDRLNAQRTIADLEISLIKNDNEREIATINEKYIRQMQDLQKNETLTAQEKTRLAELYNQQLAIDLKKQEQTQIDAEKAKQKAINDQIKLNQEAQLQAEEDFYEQYRLQVMTEQQREVDAVNSKYFQLIASAEQYGKDSQILKEQQEAEIKKIEDKYREAAVKAEKEKNEKIRAEQAQTAKDALDTAEQSIQGIQALADIGFNARMSKVKKGSKEEEALAKKQFQMNKALQLSTAVINGAQSILAITSVPDFTFGVQSAIRIGAQIALNAATIAKIASTQFSSTTSPAPPPPPPSSTSTTSAAPAFNLFGQGNDANNVGAPTDANQTSITVNAIVSETEITNSQNKIAKINQNATL